MEDRRAGGGRALLSRDQEAIGRALPCLRVLVEDSSRFLLPIDSREGKRPVGRDPNQFIPKIRDYSPFQKYCGKKMADGRYVTRQIYDRSFRVITEVSFAEVEAKNHRDAALAAIHALRFDRIWFLSIEVTTGSRLGRG